MFKKCLASFLVVLITISMLSTIAFAEPLTAKAAYGTPEIDGVIDEIWNNASKNTELVQTGKNVMNKEVDIEPCFRLLWDEKNLYVLAEVKDGTLGGKADLELELHNNDSIEIYIDQNNKKTFLRYEDDDIWIKIDYRGQLQECANVPEGTKAAAKQTSDGYVIEAMIPFTAITPKAGTVIGFEIAYNDNQDGGVTRASWAHWQDKSGSAYQNPKAFGNAELVAPAAPAAGTAAAKTNTTSSASNASNTTNPKTADSSVIPYLFAAAASAGGMILLRKRK